MSKEPACDSAPVRPTYRHPSVIDIKVYRDTCRSLRCNDAVATTSSANGVKRSLIFRKFYLTARRAPQIRQSLRVPSLDWKLDTLQNQFR